MGDILVHAVGAIAVAAGTLSLEARAQAEEPAPIDWGVRVNGSVGAADAGGALSLGSGPAARAGLDVETWVSRYVGFGVQLAIQSTSGPYEAMGCDEFCVDGSTTVYSVAPSVSLRWRTPRSFPVISLAVGYAWVQGEADEYCGDAYLDNPSASCAESHQARSESSLYGSFTAAWLFHIGSDTSAFAIGPLVRLDGWTATEGWSATTGLEIGFGGSKAEGP